MIRVIKHGNKFTAKIKKCPYCECEFTYEEEDIEERKIDIFGASFIEEYITCPECNTWLETRRVAAWV